MYISDSIKTAACCRSEYQRSASALGLILPHVKNQELSQHIQEILEKEKTIDLMASALLLSKGVEKNTFAFSKIFSAALINTALSFSYSDSKRAELVYNSCANALKRLNKNINRYSFATDTAKDIARALADCQREMCYVAQKFL